MAGLRKCDLTGLLPAGHFKGVSAGIRVPWNGITRDAMPVELTSFNIDSLALGNTYRLSDSPILRHQDTWLYSMFRAQLSSQAREIDFHVPLK